MLPADWVRPAVIWVREEMIWSSSMKTLSALTEAQWIAPATEASLRKAELDFNRKSELYQQGMASEEEIESARTAAEVEAAEQGQGEGRRLAGAGLGLTGDISCAGLPHNFQGRRSGASGTFEILRLDLAHVLDGGRRQGVLPWPPWRLQ